MVAWETRETWLRLGGVSPGSTRRPAPYAEMLTFTQGDEAAPIPRGLPLYVDAARKAHGQIAARAVHVSADSLTWFGGAFDGLEFEETATYGIDVMIFCLIPGGGEVYLKIWKASATRDTRPVPIVVCSQLHNQSHTSTTLRVERGDVIWFEISFFGVIGTEFPLVGPQDGVTTYGTTVCIRSLPNNPTAINNLWK